MRINVPYHIGLREGRLRRALYARGLSRVVRRRLVPPGRVAARLVGFSGAADLPEQVASWRSFLAHVGEPPSMILVSDGSHSEADRHLIEAIHPGVKVVDYEAFLRPGIPERVHAYARLHPFGKKLAIFLSMAADGPVIYADSDVLFFAGGGHLREVVASGEASAHFLADCAYSLDARLLRSEGERSNPVNGGFILIRRALDWSGALGRFEAMAGEPMFFTEQTMVHLTVNANGGKALPTDRYVLKADDQWRYRDAYAADGIVLRHYISSIRYKMWRQVRWDPRPGG